MSETDQLGWTAQYLNFQSSWHMGPLKLTQIHVIIDDEPKLFRKDQQGKALRNKTNDKTTY